MPRKNVSILSWCTQARIKGWNRQRQNHQCRSWVDEVVPTSRPSPLSKLSRCQKMLKNLKTSNDSCNITDVVSRGISRCMYRGKKNVCLLLPNSTLCAQHTIYHCLDMTGLKKWSHQVRLRLLKCPPSVLLLPAHDTRSLSLTLTLEYILLKEGPISQIFLGQSLLDNLTWLGVKTTEMAFASNSGYYLCNIAARPRSRMPNVDQINLSKIVSHILLQTTINM